MKLLPRILLLSAVGLFANACFLWTAKEDGETLKKDIRHLDDRLAKVEGELSEEKRRLDEMIDKAREEVVSLEETLTRATRVLARNSADFGAEMETLKDRLNAADGTFAELKHEIEQLGKDVEKSGEKVNEFALAAGLDLPADMSKVPNDSLAHYNAIKDSFSKDRFGEVRSLSNVFLDRYPKDRKADEVQLLIAKAYLEQRRWAKALGALRRFTDRYPKSDLTAEVLYEMARAFFELGDCTDARILVEAVSARHKKSPFAKKADKLLQTMNQQKSRCSS